ncbi:cation diffusion facilitator transporter family protein [Collimonas arenae]|uniref:Cation diffusion facilitator transporter family protein n=1 Tax=Collimonas arenae TaxID=279058 RepID=A0A127QI99_9BURK|nr:cation diffusion facilitator family transporter [Collimonas arenae]AMO99883.1 cation diffusion facilitator transporter family protein [Collimonas arenae]AMP09780.1 cation diffusion facilitator transporter family protein [Collimonas arenae]
MSAGHTHALPSSQNEKYIWIALGLTSTFLVVEVIGGLVTGSLALISDAAHMLTDTMALAIALAAIRIARRAPDARRTFGYHRFEILAAAFNAALLFLVAMYILYEAYQRFRSPAEIQSTGMLVIAVFGLFVNLLSMRLLSSGKDASLNVKGAYLEVWSDMLGSLGVIAGALLIRYTGWTWIDSLIAVLIGLWVLPRTWVLLKESVNILLEGVPEGMDIDQVQSAMRAVPGVLSVHDFHLWALTSGKASLTAHVVYDPAYAVEQQLLPALKDVLARQFSVYHTTLQFETFPCAHTDDGCNYGAPEEGHEASHMHV